MTRQLFNLQADLKDAPGQSFSGDEAAVHQPNDGWAASHFHHQNGDPTPAERCLVPLLREMLWQGDDRLLFEAMPHFDRLETVQDLRAVLARLNISSSRLQTSGRTLGQSQLPCLGVTGDDVLVLATVGEDGLIRAFSGQYGAAVTVSPAELSKYKLYSVQEDTDEVAKPDSRRSWFSQVFKTFRSSVYSILVMGFVLNLIALGPPLFIMAIYDKAMGAKAYDVLATMAVGLAIIITTEIALRKAKSRLQSYLGGRIDSIVGNKTFERILHLPYSMLSEAPIGTQVMRLRYFDSVRDIFQSSLFNAVVDIPFTVIFIAALFLIGGVVAIPPLALLGIYGFMAIYVLPKVQREVALVGDQKSKLNSFMIETFRNQRALRNLSAEEVWIGRFSEMSRNFNKSNVHARHLTQVLQIVSQTLMTICGILVLGIGTLSAMNGDMSMGALIATMALSWRVLNPMNQAFLSITQLAQSRTVIEQINNLMQVPMEREPGHLPKISREIRGDLKLTSLVMRYPGTTDASLKGIDLTVQYGETLAITGPSGSGKTALFQAITGLFQPQVGSVLFDGLDVRQLDAGEWRTSIGYAPDDLNFFYGTVKQNLLLAEPGAKDEELLDVCDQLGLLQYLNEHFEGLETRLNNEVLKRIPNNMKQRIVLARAFVKTAPLYLFDNPGTHLDFDGDKRFMEMVRALHGKATVILSTQRPSHMKMADRVVFMKSGQIAMAGAPEQIIPVLMGQMQKPQPGPPAKP